MSGELQTAATLRPGTHSLNKRLGGPQSRSGQFYRTANPAALTRFAVWTVQPQTVAILTILPLIPYFCRVRPAIVCSGVPPYPLIQPPRFIGLCHTSMQDFMESVLLLYDFNHNRKVFTNFI
jgi:hypothetical protein